jgi:Ca2+-binding EF-hand superfamily protein
LGTGVKDIDEGEWERILDEVDEDGNGEISFEEFRDMIYNLFGIEVDKKIR